MISVNLESLNVAFRRRSIFTNASGKLQWPSNGGGTIGLMGPSGSGKTTLARLIVEHRYGVPVKGLQILGNPTIGILPQHPVLFQHLSLVANAQFFSFSGRYRSRFDPKLFKSLAATLRMDRLLEENSNVRTLSGGEAQRVMLLRTLSVRPDLLILDEPSAGLDPSIREAFLFDLAAATSEMGIATLYIGHHWEEIAAIAAQVAYLPVVEGSDGGTVRELLVTETSTFAANPPSPQAFEAVYGPGTGVWPVEAVGSGSYRLLPKGRIASAPSLVAYFEPASSQPNIATYARAGAFRLGGIDAANAAGRSAWVYESGRLLGRATVTGFEHAI